MQEAELSTQIINYLSYYDLCLSVGSLEREMGRVTHVQVYSLREGARPEGVSHMVRFCNGGTHYELAGNVRSEGNGNRFTLDMGEGKTYRFRKLEINTPDMNLKQG